MLGVKLVVPPNAAVIECVPTLSVVRVIAALCVVGLSGAVPKTVLPFLKVTLPAATMPGATVAVKVTAWPFWDGFNEETSLVVVAAFFTLCVIAGDVLPE